MYVYGWSLVEQRAAIKETFCIRNTSSYFSIAPFLDQDTALYSLFDYLIVNIQPDEYIGI